MADVRLVQSDTGSVVVVPEEKAANVAAYGYFEEPQKQAPAKKSAAKKSDK